MAFLSVWYEVPCCKFEVDIKCSLSVMWLAEEEDRKLEMENYLFLLVLSLV